MFTKSNVNNNCFSFARNPTGMSGSPLSGIRHQAGMIFSGNFQILESARSPASTVVIGDISQAVSEMKCTNKEGKMTRLQHLCNLLPKISISVPPPRPLETFTPFSKLPIEIRLKIWEVIASVARDVTLAPRHLISNRLNYQSLAPAIMHACSESRQEGKRYYELCTETFSRGMFVFGSAVNNIWINFSVDCFVITNSMCSLLSNHQLNYEKSTLHQIQHLAVIGFPICHVENGMNRILRLLKLPKFREFTALSTRENATYFYRDWNDEKTASDGRLLRRDLFLHEMKTKAMREGVEYTKRHGLATKRLRVDVKYNDGYDDKCFL